jgi:hypothetical protein
MASWQSGDLRGSPKQLQNSPPSPVPLLRSSSVSWQNTLLHSYFSNSSCFQPVAFTCIQSQVRRQFRQYSDSLDCRSSCFCYFPLVQNREEQACCEVAKRTRVVNATRVCPPRLANGQPCRVENWCGELHLDSVHVLVGTGGVLGTKAVFLARP